MDATRLEFLCQVGMGVFGVGTAICGFGAYYFSAKSSDETTSNQTTEILDGVKESADTIKSDLRTSNEDIHKQLKSIQETVLELKNATVTGSKDLVEALGARSEWDFSQGTFEFWMLEKALLDKEPLLLSVLSKDKKRLLKIELDNRNFLTAIFRSPEIGTITRGAKINLDDVNKKGIFGPGIYIVFTWNLKEASTVLYVNAEPRDDL